MKPGVIVNKVLKLKFSAIEERIFVCVSELGRAKVLVLNKEE